MNISIVSLGRLGLRLYDHLKNDNKVFGTYNSCSKNVLHEVQYDFNKDKIPDTIQNPDILIFNLTPSIIANLESFASFVESISTKHFIFISSTSVYGMQGVVNEDTKPMPDTDSGKLLYDCERLLESFNGKYTIIRPSGLYSNSSHPGQFLAGREINIEANTSVNLIHYDDLTNLIIKSFNSEYNIINATNINHPTKYEYYTDYCIRNHLVPPVFKNFNSTKDKCVTTKYLEFNINSSLP